MSPRYFRILAHSVGGAVAIALMFAIATGVGEPLMMVPFATSIVLVMGLPEAAPAQPRAIVGGHLISATVGVVLVAIFGGDWWVAALGVGLAIGLMQLADAFHPPAGISPIIVATNHAGLTFIAVPVLAGALILLAYAWIFQRLLGDNRPVRWI